MPVVPFGDPDDHAVVLYDRSTQVCVVVSNTMTHLPSALAVVNSIGTRHAYIIAPPEAHQEIRRAVVCKSLELYEYIK